MKPWCERPHCVRNYAHQHPQAPETAPSAPESDVGPIQNHDQPLDGSGPQERSHDEALAAARDVLARADKKRRKPPKTSAPAKAEAKAGASPEVEAGDDRDGSSWGQRWEAVAADLSEAERNLEAARNARRALFAEMHDELGLAGIGELTGLSRQRVGQILKP